MTNGGIRLGERRPGMAQRVLNIRRIDGQKVKSVVENRK